MLSLYCDGRSSFTAQMDLSFQRKAVFLTETSPIHSVHRESNLDLMSKPLKETSFFFFNFNFIISMNQTIRLKSFNFLSE